MELGNNLLVYTASSPDRTSCTYSDRRSSRSTQSPLPPTPTSPANWCGCAPTVRPILSASASRALRISFASTGYTADAIHCWQIELEPTSCVFAAGDAIRLEVASSAFPLYDRNPSTASAALACGFVELAALHPDGAA